MTMTNDANRSGKRGLKPLRIAAWGAVAAMLLAPLVAMQVSSGVDWTTSDFVFAGVLLIGGGLLIELVLWRVKSPPLRIGLVLAVIGAALLAFADGAVGVF